VRTAGVSVVCSGLRYPRTGVDQLDRLFRLQPDDPR